MTSTLRYLTRAFVHHLCPRRARPAVLPAAMRPVPLHAPAAPAARSADHHPVHAAMHALQRVALDGRSAGLDDDYVAGWLAGCCRFAHSSQAIVMLMLGVPPELIERTPMPFAVPTVVRSSRPGFAIQVKVARWLRANSSRKSAS